MVKDNEIRLYKMIWQKKGWRPPGRHPDTISQMILSIQLPITVFLQVYLTSSKKVMGKYRNSKLLQILLYAIAGIVTVLNIMLLISVIRG